MIQIILILLACPVIYYYYHIYWTRNGRLLSLVPTPPKVPLIGSITFVRSIGELWELVHKFNDEYYPIYAAWLYTKAFIQIRHPDDLKVILGNNKHNEKGKAYTLLEPWLGTGLLTSAGNKWLERRKLLTPAFHSNLLQNFVHIFIEETQRTCESLKKEGGPVIKDLIPFASEHTLNIICETAMGSSLHDKAGNDSEYRKAVADLGKIIVERFIRPWLYNPWIFRLTCEGRRQSRLLKTLHGFTRTIIKERQQFHDLTDGQYLLANNMNDGRPFEFYFGNRKTRLAMLDLLIAAQRDGHIDDEGIREEVDTFMFEGHDTTSVAVCYTIMLLAEHKEIQNRVREEITAELENNGDKLTMAGLQRLSYLEMCIKESLRMYPSVPAISRQTEEEVELSGYTVPAYTVIHLFIWHTHRDPNYWPNPEVFDPDRFLPENIQDRHPYSYIPFSVGTRNCIGQRFAMLELKTIIGLLVHSFYFEPVDYLKDVKLQEQLVLRPAHPIRTKFIPVE